jgi:nicotinamidase-related amidase
VNEGSALLVLDVQRGVVERYADRPLLATLGSAVASARSRGIDVIHVRVALRPGAPEVDPDNPVFAGIARNETFRVGNVGTRSHPSVAPLAHEVIVTKRRINAFFGTDLDLILRARGIRNLVLCGIATSGVVLSTLRDASDRDYRLTVLADGCTDSNPTVHRVLTEEVFPMQARVVTAAEWADGPC